MSNNQKSAAALDFIIQFESGLCESDEEIIAGFQRLLDEGILFQLQGSYGRAGIELLRRGLIKPKDGAEVYDAYGNRVC